MVFPFGAVIQLNGELPKKHKKVIKNGLERPLKNQIKQSIGEDIKDRPSGVKNFSVFQSI